MSTAVRIVNYRGYDDPERCLGSLEPHLGLDDEVVIVDWESDRKALRRAAGRWPRAEVVSRADNRGFAAGVNLAAARSRSPYLLLLNPDAVVEGPVVRVLEDWLTRHPDVGVVGARILDEDGTLQQSARRFPDLTTWFGGRSTWLISRFPGNWLTKRNLVAANAAASGQPVDRPAPPVAFPFDPRRGVRPRGGPRSPRAWSRQSPPSSLIETDQRVSALRFGDPRVMAVFQALCAFTHLPHGFRNHDLRPSVEALLGHPYTAAQMTYDLRRLRLKDLIHRIPKTHRYTATSYGLKGAFFYSKLYLRVLRPNWAALLPDDDSLPRSLRAVLDQLDAEIHKLHQDAALAA